MSKGIRNALTVVMILFTGLVVLACAGIGAEAQSGIYYDLAYDAKLDIVDVEVEKIGTIYNNKKSEEGKIYYQMDITLKNDTNVNVNRYGTTFSYDVDSGYVSTVYEDGIFYTADQYIIPAGGEGKVIAIVQIPEENQAVEIYEWEYEDERYEVELP